MNIYIANTLQVDIQQQWNKTQSDTINTCYSICAVGQYSWAMIWNTQYNYRYTCVNIHLYAHTAYGLVLDSLHAWNQKTAQ